MHRTLTLTGLALVAGVAFLSLAGCSPPAPPAEIPTPTVPQPEASAPSASAAERSPGVSPPSGMVQPAAGAQSPALVSTVKSAGEPAVSSMNVAEPPHKLGAPVDLRYQFESDVKADQPVILHLAAVPRVAGGKLTMSVKKETGINSTVSELTVQKASASTPYRQELSVTKLSGGPSELHVLVMMELPEGLAHSWFKIPLDGEPATGKQQPTRFE